MVAQEYTVTEKGCVPRELLIDAPMSVSEGTKLSQLPNLRHSLKTPTSTLSPPLPHPYHTLTTPFHA